MHILGYGEGALTYWALSRHMIDVIGPPPLNDDSPPEKTVFMYRPSFGRAGGDGSAQFGEFDAIVATPKGVYLIESKWTGEPIFDGRVRLAGRQIRRHEVFRWIRERWLEQAPANWAQFYNHNGNVADFAARFERKPLAQPGHRLTSNLEYILQQLPGRSVARRRWTFCSTSILNKVATFRAGSKGPTSVSSRSRSTPSIPRTADASWKCGLDGRRAQKWPKKRPPRRLMRV